MNSRCHTLQDPYFSYVPRKKKCLQFKYDVPLTVKLIPISEVIKGGTSMYLRLRKVYYIADT